jgi:hypothetical protein
LGKLNQEFERSVWRGPIAPIVIPEGHGMVNTAAKAAQKNFKIFKKKLASASAHDLDRMLSGQRGPSSVQKKMKKKLVRL